MDGLTKILERLHAANVEFSIIGGLAARIHGSSYNTDDLDVCARLLESYPFGECYVLNLDALINAKEAVGRDHDRLTVRQLRAIKEKLQQ